jgi:hypothetical protein
VAQVACVNKNFKDAGIMVHAYLMYGFPTQTAQETIDSLEMVRQLFEAGILQSAFWHQFAMTAHSPVGMNPSYYKVEKKNTTIGTFANNDIEHIDPTGAEHDSFSFGLKKSLLNYMHGACFDYPLQKWFEFKTPKTSVKPTYIIEAIENEIPESAKPTAKLVWLGVPPKAEYFIKSKKGNQWEMCSLTFQSTTETIEFKVNKAFGDWLINILPILSIQKHKLTTLQEVKENFEAAGLIDFELFWDNKPVNSLFKVGLLQL